MKERLDVLLVKQGLAESREKAKAVIMAGEVFVQGQREDKADDHGKGKLAALCEPRRSEAGKGDGVLPDHTGG